MTAREELIEAEAKARAAREALTATLVELQARVTPRALAREALDEIRETSIEFGRAALDAAKRNPGPVLAAAAAVVALFTRRQIAEALTPAPSPPADPEQDDD